MLHGRICYPRSLNTTSTTQILFLFNILWTMLFFVTQYCEVYALQFVGFCTFELVDWGRRDQDQELTTG